MNQISDYIVNVELDGSDQRLADDDRHKVI